MISLLIFDLAVQTRETAHGQKFLRFKFNFSASGELSPLLSTKICSLTKPFFKKKSLFHSLICSLTFPLNLFFKKNLFPTAFGPCLVRQVLPLFRPLGPPQLCPERRLLKGTRDHGRINLRRRHQWNIGLKGNEVQGHADTGRTGTGVGQKLRNMIFRAFRFNSR